MNFKQNLQNISRFLIYTNNAVFILVSYVIFRIYTIIINDKAKIEKIENILWLIWFLSSFLITFFFAYFGILNNLDKFNDLTILLDWKFLGNTVIPIVTLLFGNVKSGLLEKWNRLSK
uniref:Succinate dehydrogenase hydrophobic anchor subunit n=1 Tax=Methanococcus maripaludis (strain C6 / ATCC BAA-1332) TaxID=444158 RepID=A9ABA0_METM6